MPAITNLQDLFVDMLRDIYYAEKKIVKTLPKLSKAVKKETPDLAAAFDKHCQETEGQIERLEQVFEIIGKKASGKKCEAIEGILAEGDELMKTSECACTLAAGLLAGAQAVEHYEMARYGTLVEWAKLLGLKEAAGLLQETLEQETNTDKSLTKLAASKVNQAAANAMKESDEDEEETSNKRQLQNPRRAA